MPRPPSATVEVATAAYVGMTRGRARNVAHLVAANHSEARKHWIEVFARDRADLGPDHAAATAADAIERYEPRAPQRLNALQIADLYRGTTARVHLRPGSANQE